MTLRLAYWVPSPLCHSTEYCSVQSLFHLPFGFLGAGLMSLDALQGQMTCQHTEGEYASQKHHPGRPALCVFVDSWAVSYTVGT